MYPKLKKGHLIEYNFAFLDEKHVCVVLEFKKDLNFGKIVHVFQDDNTYFIPLNQMENVKILNEHKNTNL